MEQAEIWNSILFTVGDYHLRLSQLVTALVAMALTLLVAKMARRAFVRIGQRSTTMLNAPQAYVMARISNYAILLVGFLIAISMLGIDVSKLALVASALGIGIGLGLQSIVNNFVSGLAILLEHSLKVGDFVELDSGVTGEVMAIHMRATLIRTNDNVDILIPNSELTNQKLINWTLEESVRRFRVPFGVAYGSDKELVRKAVLEAAAAVPYTLDLPGRAPIVWMNSFGDSSLNFVLGVWVEADQVKRPTALMSDYLWAIDDALRRYNIEIPFPQRDLHIRSNKATFDIHHSGQDSHTD
ncbi:mechanosensitive ion channel family protein [Pseudomaricurvus sp. HS19]|uniref:mechanosensitive ion channel family protein n=1 Tax=Pseudomaricurvus sp. HS19 TaxID=2692626 RepID=UPI00136BE31F|nr:mechanosensitive ion channel domain-containing protein [Pseudomaricurvus sp. HS19]MYM64535.1 mechanosensitive ion channel [Pseudomaricurvus sp. HS19]